MLMRLRMAVCTRTAAVDVPNSRSLEMLWRRMRRECGRGDMIRSFRRRKTERAQRASILQRPQAMVEAGCTEKMCTEFRRFI